METKVLEYRLPLSSSIEEDINRYSIDGYEVKSSTTYIDNVSKHFGIKLTTKLIIILQRKL